MNNLEQTSTPASLIQEERTIEEVLKDYIETIKSVIDLVGEFLPNISFVFVALKPTHAANIFIVTPDMTPIMYGNLSVAIQNVVADYPPDRFELKYIFHALHGRIMDDVLPPDLTTRDHIIFGGMDMHDVSVHSLFPIEEFAPNKNVQFNIFHPMPITVVKADQVDKPSALLYDPSVRNTLLGALRNEYLIQQSMLAPKIA